MQCSSVKLHTRWETVSPIFESLHPDLSDGLNETKTPSHSVLLFAALLLHATHTHHITMGLGSFLDTCIQVAGPVVYYGWIPSIVYLGACRAPPWL